MNPTVTKEQAEELARILGANQQQVDMVSGSFANQQQPRLQPEQLSQLQGIVDRSKEKIAGSKALQLATGHTSDNFYTQQNLTTAQDSVNLLSKYGLQGIVNNTNMLSGLTPAKAEAEAKKMQDMYKSQSSALTSSVYNPETISGARGIVNNFQLRLDDLNNNLLESKGTKEENKQIMLESTASELARLFPSRPDLLNQYNANPEVKTILDKYISAGGSLDNVATKIPNANQIQMTGDQSTDQYLQALNSVEFNARQDAIESLAPEKAVYQAEIMRVAGIAKEFENLYFGTEERMGILDRQRIEAEETAKIADRKIEAEKDSARAMMQYNTDKYNAELSVAKATTERNRQAAKNYMTAQLAKLGALKTSGAAPEALGILEQKYQEQAQQLETQYTFAIRDLDIKYNKYITDLEIERDETRQKISQNLSKSEDDIYKELTKLNQATQKELLTQAGKYATLLRTQTDKYKKEAEASAKKNVSDMEEIMSEYKFREIIPSTGIGGQNVTGATRTPTTEAQLREHVNNLLGRGILSSRTENVLSGKTNLGDYTEANQTAILNELKKYNIDFDKVRSAGVRSGSSGSSLDEEPAWI
jgi:hypothetical protein